MNELKSEKTGWETRADHKERNRKKELTAVRRRERELSDDLLGEIVQISEKNDILENYLPACEVIDEGTINLRWSQTAFSRYHPLALTIEAHLCALEEESGAGKREYACVRKRNIPPACS
ncbi:hypothetical protein NPIL_235921 [Nephila pilipes]|uniref:Uncharacterized protein n=1 Tax=Nephila pilipes TaxID=299642 RepID=A0A8X6PRQ5_NEPPI|nr:hypothetical protein NPIL_235921 [Nephila pilipes]